MKSCKTVLLMVAESALTHGIPETDDSTLPEIMPPGYSKLLKEDDLDGDTALDMGCLAKDGLLQTLESVQHHALHQPRTLLNTKALLLMGNQSRAELSVCTLVL